MSDADAALQDRYAPHSICFGCGPANAEGLRIKSRRSEAGEVVATWRPAPHHQAFPGVLNGGIIGALLDCHGNWTAASELMVRRGLDAPPTCVTAEFTIKLLRPTPAGAELTIRARAASVEGDKVNVEGTLETQIDGVTKACATLRGLFVAVKPGHPAYGRW